MLPQSHYPEHTLQIFQNYCHCVQFEGLSRQWRNVVGRARSHGQSCSSPCSAIVYHMNAGLINMPFLRAETFGQFVGTCFGRRNIRASRTGLDARGVVRRSHRFVNLRAHHQESKTLGSCLNFAQLRDFFQTVMAIGQALDLSLDLPNARITQTEAACLSNALCARIHQQA